MEASKVSSRVASNYSNLWVVSTRSTFWPGSTMQTKLQRNYSNNILNEKKESACTLCISHSTETMQTIFENIRTRSLPFWSLTIWMNVFFFFASKKKSENIQSLQKAFNARRSMQRVKYVWHNFFLSEFKYFDKKGSYHTFHSMSSFFFHRI